jgi:hypothetical protein
MEFVWNYEIFSKTRDIIKVCPFWYSVYLPTCVHVLGCGWVQSLMQEGVVSLFGLKLFHIWLGLFACKNVCAGPGLLHLGPTFSHIKRGQVWPLELGPEIFPEIRGHVSWSQALGFLIIGLVISGNSYMGPAQPSLF